MKDLVLTTLLPHYETEAILVEKIPYEGGDASGYVLKFKYEVKDVIYFIEITDSHSYGTKINEGDIVEINVLKFNNNVAFVKIWYNYLFRILSSIIITVLFLISYFRFDWIEYE